MTRMLANPPWTRMPGSGASVRPKPGAELTFRPSPGPSLGVELELLVLDPRTRDLAPGSVRILEACAAESVPGVTAELMQSMIEVKTGVCRDVAGVRGQLVPSLRRMHELARLLGYGLALAGTHPFHQTSTSVVFPAERYEAFLTALFATQDRWAYARGADHKAEIGKIAAVAGMSPAAFEAAWTNVDLARAILAERQRGEQEYRVQATPTFVFNRRVVGGNIPFDRFSREAATPWPVVRPQCPPAKVGRT